MNEARISQIVSLTLLKAHVFICVQPDVNGEHKSVDNSPMARYTHVLKTC